MLGLGGQSRLGMREGSGAGIDGKVLGMVRRLRPARSLSIQSMRGRFLSQPPFAGSHKERVRAVRSSVGRFEVRRLHSKPSSARCLHADCFLSGLLDSHVRRDESKRYIANSIHNMVTERRGMVKSGAQAGMGRVLEILITRRIIGVG